MITRRAALWGLFGASVLPVVATRAAGAGPFRSYVGCCVAPADFSKIEAYNLPPDLRVPKYDPRADPIVGESGRGKDFDEALGEVLAMLSRMFGVTPGFGFYDDRASMNALAAPVTRVAGTRDLVLFGLNMLDHLLGWPRDGESAVVAVCAHEFGHVYQYATPYYNRLQRELPGYCTELHADFLAGYFMHRFEKARTIGLQGVGEIWESLGSSDFNRPLTHGTSEQRITAIEGGYFFARSSQSDLAEIATAAYEHVRRVA